MHKSMSDYNNLNVVWRFCKYSGADGWVGEESMQVRIYVFYVGYHERTLVDDMI